MTPSMSDLWRVFGRIGLLSFGGPAVQIALMHKELVEDRSWLSEKQFLGALSFCMLLPGPEAMQLATYTGWRLRGTIGGLLAGLLFVIPGALVILLLAALYISYGTLPLVQTAFVGVKAAVVAVVVQALIKVSKKALTSIKGYVLAVTAFIALYAFGVPFPLIVIAAGMIGWLINSNTALVEPAAINKANTLPQTMFWMTLWAAPIALIYALDQTFLTEIALFFSKLAIVTFGGAYAVLAYMTQTVALDFGWITTEQMIDALGLAETTPGPLILVTEFVALLAGYQTGGITMMLAAGGLALWCTFVPCFLWIFAAAAYVENILAKPRLKGALDGITAAVVGVILNLSLWFALHVVFTDVVQAEFGAVPEIETFSIRATLLCGLAAFLLFYRKMSLPLILLINAAAAILLAYLLP